jgi:hypothetical protein
MQDRDNTAQAHTNGTTQAGRSSNGAGTELHPDQELVYRLKTAIDQRGRYSFRLDDMAAGFAAGQGISNAAARRAIEDRFTQQMGQSPQEYLDRHYDERRELDQSSTRSRPERGNGSDRGR